MFGILCTYTLIPVMIVTGVIQEKILKTTEDEDLFVYDRVLREMDEEFYADLRKDNRVSDERKKKDKKRTKKEEKPILIIILRDLHCRSE